MEKIDGIAEALGTTFKTTDIVKIDNTIKDVQLSNQDSNKLTLEDKQFLKMELTDIISSMKVTKEIIEEQIRKPPFKASELEALAVYSEKLINAMKELRMLDMDIINTELNQRKLDQSYQLRTGNITNNVQNNTFLFDAKSLDLMLDNASKNKKIDDISVDFEIDEQIK